MATGLDSTATLLRPVMGVFRWWLRRGVHQGMEPSFARFVEKVNEGAFHTNVICGTIFLGVLAVGAPWFAALVPLGVSALIFATVALNHARQYTAAQVTIAAAISVGAGAAAWLLGPGSDAHWLCICSMLSAYMLFRPDQAVARSAIMAVNAAAFFLFLVLESGGHWVGILSAEMQAHVAVAVHLMVFFDILTMMARLVGDAAEDREDMRRARVEAEQAVATRSAFLANMCHEMRTPLGAVLEVHDRLRDELDDPAARAWVDDAADAGGRLMHVLDDILCLSRLEAGRLRLDPRRFALHDLAERWMDRARPAAKARGLRVSCSVDDGSRPYRRGDDGRIGQVLDILLSNALKFTSEGEIALRIEPLSAERVRFSVADTGIGMDPDQVGRVFEAFEQADRRTNRRYGGSGLGLSIAQRLVRVLGGQLDVVTALDEGSEFSFVVRLPASWTEVAVDPHAPLPALSVLVAEDAPVNQMVLRRVLEELGHVVTMTSNGAELLDTFAQGSFDAVLVDVDMPVVDGLTAMERLRDLLEGQARRVPLLALVGDDDEAQRQRCFDIGVDGCLNKPVRRRLLDETLRRVLAEGAASTPAVERAGQRA